MPYDYTLNNEEPKSEFELHGVYQRNKDGWGCYLFGTTDNTGIVYYPTEGNIPNWFVRWMMKVCLGCTWVKEPKNGNK